MDFYASNSYSEVTGSDLIGRIYYMSRCHHLARGSSFSFVAAVGIGMGTSIRKQQRIRPPT
ncbi:hypothetical protein BU24DRAFT_422227 [Aaosphaeria arxii CBS 175.79]|uniref:Uncharacterized protein n=1 Tax=Aaosphaeria arxii CBS 175.79 TaxID=1450172 RepID=A0A6A5XSX9_9PLEO|nr:uncharacterized protein BU24DRAFT_422227 [Aaosphaeria arxii CBS 175.79]KAF2015917.1 hypothetical protein BU24DRAFT_422227 [Aaosphaeria arxii CBS 175.79]